MAECCAGPALCHCGLVTDPSEHDITTDEQHTESVIDMTIDYVTDAAYIVLNSNEVVETKELTSNINIDIDEFGNPCGVELLTLNLRIK